MAIYKVGHVRRRWRARDHVSLVSTPGCFDGVALRNYVVEMSDGGSPEEDPAQGG
jgi:hypothetical protein